MVKEAGRNGDVNVGSKFPLSFWEITMASTVVLGFLFGLLCVYLTMPASDYSFLKLPRTLEDLQILKDHLESYTSDYTILHSLHLHANFHDPRDCLYVFACWSPFWSLQRCSFGCVHRHRRCFFLLFLIKADRAAPDKLSSFQAQVAKRKEGLLNYMLFLRVTPTLPNTFINVASPIVDVPYHIF